MFWSKLWFFLLALAAAAALTIALVLPRPAQRTTIEEQHHRLEVACGVVDILLADNAARRVELAGSFSRAPEIVAALDAASSADKLDDARAKQVSKLGNDLISAMDGLKKPDFAMMIDRRGRVVGRAHVDETDWGDVVAARPLIDDALAGYLRDDLWVQNGTIYLVSASPVIKRDAPVTYVGAVVLGFAVTTGLSQNLVSSLGVDVGFFVGNEDIAASRPIGFDHATMLATVKGLTGPDVGKDCQANQPFDLHAGSDDFSAIVARLPGEATARGAYYTVFLKKPTTLGFMATLHEVKQSDLSFASFPWVVVGGGFLLALVIGIGLMFVESDRPLRRLTADAVKLGAGGTERLSEDAHAGKFGSIARSVNIHIDKLGREAKVARKDLDGLLGPGSDGSMGTIDLLATALPAVRPGGAAPMTPPPPSDFRFGEPAAATFTPAPAPVFPMSAPPPRAPTPPPRAATPPPRPGTAPAVPPQSTQPLSLDDDILGGGSGAPAAPAEAAVDPYFKSVFDQFVAVKKSCNESIAGLVYAKFADKLVKNRDDLIAKTGCREVRFTVYVKDGKAALKATPVKDE